MLQSSTPVRLAKIQLECDVMQGTVTVRVVETPLHIPDTTFLLGNDLAGSAVVPVLAIRDSPLPYNPTEDIEKDQPALFPMCAVIRAQAERAAELEEDPVLQVLPNTTVEGATSVPLQEVTTLSKLISE